MKENPFFNVGKCLITKLHITSIMMWNKYKESGKILITNRLHGNKLYNHLSMAQHSSTVMNNVCLTAKYCLPRHVHFSEGQRMGAGPKHSKR